MSLEQAVHLRWQNDAPLAALVPITRVFTGKAVGSPVLPYVVLTRQATEPVDYTSSGTRIARAVVQCLRRPCPEVWTSLIVRATAALMTLSPRFTSLVMRRMAKR